MSLFGVFEYEIVVFDTQSLLCHITKYEFLNFATCSHGHFGNKLYVGRNLVTCHIVCNVVLDIFFGNGTTLSLGNECIGFFAVFFTGNRNYLNVYYVGVSIDEVLDFFGEDVLTTTDNHIL